MKTNIIKIFLILFTIFFAQQSYAQIIGPTGTTSSSSSQLIYFYDQSTVVDNEMTMGDTSYIQVTNTSLNQETWIHVQIFRNYDIDGAGGELPVICDERDFIDMLTPRDTHVYNLALSNFPKNMGENQNDEGEHTSIDVRGTKGFIIITPVVSQSDLSGIAFQHLIGATNDDVLNFRLSAMGRDAVDFATGEIAADGTVMDGVTNGYLILQPEEIVFNVPGNFSSGDFIGIAFQDQYGDAGLLGYQVLPAIADWTTFIFDYKESPTSCGDKTIECFSTSGLNGDIGQNNTFLGPSLLCGGAGTPENPENGLSYGWTRIFVSGLDEYVNNLGVMYINDTLRGADWMYVRGERTEITPPTAEDCSVPGDEDGDGFADCLDTDCATAEECETGQAECTNGVDDDMDGVTDCADLGCDGIVIDDASGAVCETGGEVSCNDGFDNDGNGLVDANDPNCQSGGDEGNGNGGGGGGGCTITSTSGGSSSAANFMIMIFSLSGIYFVRRMKMAS